MASYFIKSYLSNYYTTVGYFSLPLGALRSGGFEDPESREERVTSSSCMTSDSLWITGRGSVHYL